MLQGKDTNYNEMWQSAVVKNILFYAPSVAMNDVPPDALDPDENPLDEYKDEAKIQQAEEDKRIEPNNEFYDGDKDQDGDTEMAENTQSVLNWPLLIYQVTNSEIFCIFLCKA